MGERDVTQQENGSLSSIRGSGCGVAQGALPCELCPSGASAGDSRELGLIQRQPCSPGAVPGERLGVGGIKKTPVLLYI